MKKILIVGFGSASKRHIKNLYTQDNNCFFFILSRKKKINQFFLKKSSYKHIKSINEIQGNKIKYSFICTGSNEHLKYLRILYKYNHDIFIEKPVLESAKDINELDRILKKYKKKIFVGYNYLFNKTINHLKKLNIKKEKINKISMKVGYYLPFWRKNIHYEKTVSSQKKMGGGVLLELSHEINYLLYLFGKPLWTSAILNKISNLKINVEDNAFITLRFKNFICFLEMDLVSRNYTRFCKVDTNKNSYLMDLGKNKIMKFKYKNKKSILFNESLDVNHSYLNQLEFFQRSNSRTIRKYTNLAIDTLKIIKAIRLSSKKKGQMQKIYY
jgi:predicted dehydrogenase